MRCRSCKSVAQRCRIVAARLWLPFDQRIVLRLERLEGLTGRVAWCLAQIAPLNLTTRITLRWSTTSASHRDETHLIDMNLAAQLRTEPWTAQQTIRIPDRSATAVAES